MPVKYRTGHPTRKFKEVLQMLSPVFQDRFVPFERHICVRYYKYRLICLDALAEILSCKKSLGKNILLSKFTSYEMS